MSDKLIFLVEEFMQCNITVNVHEAEEEPAIGKTEICDFCDGTGEALVIMPDGRNEYMMCSNCKGMGEIEESELLEN